MSRKATKNPKDRALPLRLREMRQKKGWSQAELGAMLDTSDASINRLENGKQNWTPDLLRDAARVFECSIYDLLPPQPGSFLAKYQRLDDSGQAAAEAMIDGLAGAKRQA